LEVGLGKGLFYGAVNIIKKAIGFDRGIGGQGRFLKQKDPYSKMAIRLQ